MDVGELPMILFTVLAQMSVGAFIVLGLIQTFGSMKYSAKTVDAVADPALLAIGPTLVLGLLVSMLHMHDLTNTFNVVRHFGTSWLSAEIVFGLTFAALGFVFAILQWRKIGPPRLRQALAVVTALVGIVLIYAMSMVYYSLVSVPAWNNVQTPLSFYLTAIILGSLAVGTAFMITVSRNKSMAENPEVGELVAASLKGIALTVVIAGGISLIRLPLFVSDLASQGGAALQSAEAIPPDVLALRLILLAAAVGLMAMFMFFYASNSKTMGTRPLTIVTISAFLLALWSEFIGRSLFYHVMERVGV